MNRKVKVSQLRSAIISFLSLCLLLSMVAPFGAVASNQSADAVYDFEDGTTLGWYAGWGNFAETNPLSISEDLATANNRYSLKANTIFSGSEWQAAAIALDTNVDLGQYATVSYDIIVPADFGGEFVLSTALNGAWEGLDYSSHPIASSPLTSINGGYYTVIHKTIAIPASAAQRQLIIQLAKNSEVSYDGPIYIDNIVLTAREAGPVVPEGPVVTTMASEALLLGEGVEYRTAPVDGDTLYDGEGYVSFFYNEELGNGSATFSVTVDKTDLYQLYVGYYAPYGYKESGLVINGSGGGTLGLPDPTEGSVRGEARGGKVLLQAGSNSITFTRNWGYYGIEYVKVASATQIVSDKLEAEDGIMTGSVSAASSISGYSGKGYAAFQQDGGLMFTYQASSEGLHDIVIGYSSPFGDKRTEMIVNGQSTIEIGLVGSEAFQEVAAGKAMLQAGENTIQFNANWGWYNIDYIRISNAEDGGNLHDVEKTLVNLSATPETQAMMNYLVDVYGNGIISGQQNTADAEWVYEQTGKYPALLGLDMMDYSPSRVERGASSMTIEQAKEWADQGGIIHLTWHWNAPKDLLDEPGNEWWSGFYTRATTFDVAYALENPESEDYQLLIRDIDAIANELKHLQDAKIPVLWRPLHEAEGGWFWWGAKGPEAAKELYRLMYDRMTNEHGLNNLIWVWNSESIDWFPGEDVVDIASIDYYGQKADYNPLSSKYDNLASLVNDRKLIALAENGPIPDPELLQLYGADWLFFMTWGGDFIRDGLYNEPVHLQKVYHNDYVITRDELPEYLYAYGVAPYAEVSYSEIASTNQDVVATITTNKPVTITNNGGSSSYNFTENGSFTFEFMDEEGLEGTVVATVGNIDKVGPTITVWADKPVLPNVNHKLEEVTFQWEAEDHGSGIAGVMLVSVTSNEPDNGSGDGNSESDIQGAEIGTEDNHILLRAERAGSGSGRVYTITYEAVDYAGNSTQASTTVLVPHSEKKLS